MSKATFLHKLDTELEQVFDLKPNDLYLPVLTHWYKVLTKPLKSVPFVYLIPIAVFITLATYVLFGFSVVRLVTLLQHGL